MINLACAHKYNTSERYHTTVTTITIGEGHFDQFKRLSHGPIQPHLRLAPNALFNKKGYPPEHYLIQPNHSQMNRAPQPFDLN